jgi:pimeloyl-ACP methyl ester carboxylesterase
VGIVGLLKHQPEADDLAALLDDRKISHAAIVAGSHGGEVALNVALRYTAYVTDLVLVGPAAIRVR